MKKLKLCIASSGEMIYDGTAEAVFLPSAGGMCELLPGHAYYMTLLRRGKVRIQNEGQEKTIVVSSGIALNRNNTVSILIFGEK